MVADASGLVSGAQQGAGALDRVGDSAERAGGKAREFGSFTAEQTAQLRANAAAINQVVRATNPAISNQQLLEGALNRVRNGYIQGTVSAEAYARAEAIAARGAIELAAANRTATNSTGQMRFGTMMLGQQIQDVGIQLASGAGFLRTFAMQAGQTALAVQQMGGAGSGFARFIGGPWGSLILAGVSVLAVLTAGMMSNAEAAEAAHAGADGLSDAQGVLGGMFDLTSGKIERQNALLRANITLMAVQMQAQALQEREQARATYQSLGYRGTAARLGTIGEAIRLGVSPTRIPEQQRRTDAYSLRVQRLLSDVGAGRVSSERALQLSAQIDFSGLNITREDFQQAIINRLSSSAKEDTAARMLSSLNAGVLDPGLRRSGRGGGGGRQRRGRRATDQTEFGQDTADRLTSITQRFVDAPPQVEAVRKALADVDDIATDIERRHPPNYEALLAQARAARPIIEAGINKPFNDFIRSQEQSLQLLGLQARGHDAEAEALQHILQLEQQQGPLDNAKRLAILANVRAIQQEQRAVEVLHEHQQLYLNTLAETRKEITDTVEGMLSGDFSSLTRLPGQILNSFNRLTAERLVEQLFGPAFRELEDHVTGRDSVRSANLVLARSSTDTAHSIADLGTAARQTIDSINNPTTAGAPTGSDAGAEDGDIVVTATRNDPIYTNPRQFFQNMVQGLLRGLVGEEFARALSVGISRALEGAAVGGMVAGIGKSLGIKTSSTGGQIGGAIGGIAASALGLPPILGELLGGALGSVVGGLFKKSKTGSATLTNAHDTATTSGNNAAYMKAASGLATSIQDTILNIAQQLGGSVGSFAVSIGQKDGKYRVDPTGRGNVKTKKGAIDFGDDEGAAVAYAIMDAVRDGAVSGLSAAVQQALRSSTDINRAIQEAMKVQEVETLVKGVTGAMEKQLREFEAQAAERIRIARQYGFDVVAIEKINADDRLKLHQQILEQQIGSLQDLLNDMNFGSLFEGSLSDQRDKIIAELDQATADAKAGVAGAADRQAELSRNLIDLSKEAFGTAGPEYAADLDRARSGAEQVIALENERLKAAEDAVKETNSQLNEANDQLAQQTSILQSMAGSLASIASGGGAGASIAESINAVDTRRFSLLA